MRNAPTAVEVRQEIDQHIVAVFHSPPHADAAGAKGLAGATFCQAAYEIRSSFSSLSIGLYVLPDAAAARSKRFRVLLNSHMLN